MGFYTYYSGLDPSLVPWAQLSHVAHAFLGLGSDGSLTPPSGYLNPALNAAAHAHGVKILASIGGAGSGATYSAMSADPAARAAFVNNAYAFLLANAYDGVDLDYEFPSNATDRANLNLLVQALRARFNAGGQAWLITGDLNWGSYYGQWWDVATLKSSMDWFNLMEYDMFGSWSGYSGHNAPLNDSTLPGGAAFSGTNGSASVAYYLGRGVPPQQLVYGIAAYGYRYDTAALYQACAAGDCSSANNWPYSAVAAAIGSGWTRSWDASASSPYLTSSNGLQVISYDDPQSVLAKAQAMVWTHNLGGTFVWELSQDLVGSTHPLVAAMATAGYCAPYTPTLTPTVTPSITPNGTFTATPTGSPSATVSPTPSISRTPANGPLAIGAVAPVPQPNPRWLDVQMLGPADELTVKVYSANLALVRPPLRLKALGQGWDLVELSPLTVGLPNGIYFVWAQARRGGQSSPVARARLVVLK
jgi:GH18 family chitinase